MRQPVPSTDLTSDEVMQLLSSQNPGSKEQAAAITQFDFQQAINCCGLTSVAYALTALGYPTSVDDLFRELSVNVESAVGDGMTLAEIHDACLKYVDRKKLPIFVDCCHFDDTSASMEGFQQACTADDISGANDVLVLNFHSGIAHGWSSGGGGHFSVLSGLCLQTNEIIMADVHGLKYGKFWSTPLWQMFNAMADKDSCGRARGALRFGKLNMDISRPLEGLTPTLTDWNVPSAPYLKTNLSKYIPEMWDEGKGVKNMEGVSALSSAMRILEGDSSPLSRLDLIMRYTNASYSYHLNNFLTAGEIADMVHKLNKSGKTKAKATVKQVAKCSPESLRSGLREAGCGKDGVAILASYDFNKAFGAPLIEDDNSEAGVLTHGTKSWSLLAGLDDSADVSDTNGVVIAPAHNVILAGRLWSTSLKRMSAGIEAVGKDECEFVLIEHGG